MDDEARVALLRGTIKTRRNSLGFGFIAPDHGGPNRFFHASAVEGTTFAQLRVGQRVEFAEGEDARHPGQCRAVLVRLLA
jgi:CspA family cold shock protein